MIAQVLLVVLAYLAYKVTIGRQKGSVNLPGPQTWPIFGNLLQIDAMKPHLTLDKWHREIGKIFKFHQFGQTVVVVGDAEAMHEALVKKGDDFAGRVPTYRMKLWTDFHPEFQDGVIVTKPDASWKKLRMCIQRNLKQFDVGLGVIQNVTTEVLHDFTENIMALDGKPFEPRRHLMNAIMNNLTLFLLGRKFSLDEELFNKFIEIEHTGMELWSVVGKHARLDVFPWLANFGVFNETKEAFATFKKDTHSLYLEMKETMVPSNGGKNMSMLEDLFGVKDEVHGGETRLEKTCINLIFAGSGTSTSSMHALLNILTHHKDVQKKLQSEVDDVIGDRPVRLSDKEHMPYTRATIFELLRYTSIVPISVPHMTTRDIDLRGVQIPANTPVYMNLFSQLHDADYWPEPYTFKPERFLDTDGNLVAPDHINRKRLMPFGAGTRVCLGEMFALARLFMLTAHIVQRFDLDQDEPKVSYDPRTYDMAVVFTPPDFKLKMTPRSSTVF